MARHALLLAVAILLAPMARAQSTGAPLLTPADIEHATGLTGVKLRPPRPGQLKGDLAFVLADDTPVIAVNFFDAAAFEQGKKPVVSIVGDTKITTDLFHAAVAGVGDDAYDGPNEDVPYISYVRVGPRAFSLLALSRGGRRLLTPVQRRDLAKVLAARMR